MRSARRSNRWRTRASLAKKLERGRFIWPTTNGDAVTLSAAQLGYLLEGIDWRAPIRTQKTGVGGVIIQWFATS